MPEAAEKDARAGGALRRLLLHACCAPCATHPPSVLAAQGFDVTLFFYNPNIQPVSEHDARRDEALRFAETAGLPILCPDPDFEAFEAAAAGLEAEPEGGARCIGCFELRLGRTARAAAEGGFSAFASTLSISPHKSPAAIDSAGRAAAAAAGVEYVPTNFKKKGGFQESVRLSKELGLYRQSWCGCRFSRREKP